MPIIRSQEGRDGKTPLVRRAFPPVLIATREDSVVDHSAANNFPWRVSSSFLPPGASPTR